MTRRSRRDEHMLAFVELPRFAAMSAASNIQDAVVPALELAMDALEAGQWNRAVGCLRVAQEALDIVERDIRRWADRDARRYGYPYAREEAA